MGMFDWIDHEAECPECGAQIEGFQTKEVACLLRKLTPHELLIEFEKDFQSDHYPRSYPYFYGYCECGEVTSFSVVPEHIKMHKKSPYGW